MSLPHIIIDDGVWPEVISVLVTQGVEVTEDGPASKIRDLTTTPYICTKDRRFVRILLSKRDSKSGTTVTFMTSEPAASQSLVEQIIGLVTTPNS